MFMCIVLCVLVVTAGFVVGASLSKNELIQAREQKDITHEREAQTTGGSKDMSTKTESIETPFESESGISGSSSVSEFNLESEIHAR